MKKEIKKRRREKIKRRRQEVDLQIEYERFFKNPAMAVWKGFSLTNEK
jgi:hypothetical protein